MLRVSQRDWRQGTGLHSATGRGVADAARTSLPSESLHNRLHSDPPSAGSSGHGMAGCNPRRLRQGLLRAESADGPCSHRVSGPGQWARSVGQVVTKRLLVTMSIPSRKKSGPHGILVVHAGSVCSARPTSLRSHRFVPPLRSSVTVHPYGAPPPPAGAGVAKRRRSLARPGRVSR